MLIETQVANTGAQDGHPSDCLSSGRITRNTVALFVSASIVALANLLITLTIGRTLGALVLGIYAFSAATARIVYAISDLGIGTHLKRTIARNPTLAPSHTNLFITFRILIMPLAVVVVAGSGVAMGYSHMGVIFTIAAAFGLNEVGKIHEALFIARLRVYLVFLTRMVYATSLISGCLLWYYLGGDFLGICQVIFVAWFLNLICNWVSGRISEGFWPYPSWNTKLFLQNIIHSIPIGASTVLAIATVRCPVLFLSWFRGPEETGQYAAVEMFVFATTMMQTAVSNVSYPVLSRSFGTIPNLYRQTFIRSNITLLSCGLAFAICFTFWGGDIVRFVFPHKDYSGLDTVACILGWATPLLLLIHHNIFVFAASHQERVNTLLMCFGLAMVVTFEWILVPHWGLIGAALGVSLGRLLGLAAILGVMLARGINYGRARV